MHLVIFRSVSYRFASIHLFHFCHLKHLLNPTRSGTHCTASPAHCTFVCSYIYRPLSACFFVQTSSKIISEDTTTTLLCDTSNSILGLAIIFIIKTHFTDNKSISDEL